MDPMSRPFRRLALAALLALAAVPAGAQDQPPSAAEQVVDGFDHVLLDVMQHAAQLGYDGRFAKLDPAIHATFNVPLMTRIVVGARWGEWGDAQREQVIEAFGRFIVATYARRFDGYDGESFVIDGSKPAAGGTLVMTRMVRKTEAPISLSYVVRDNGDGAPQVVDVFLTGTISELATRRSEFGAVLEHDGFNGLLALLAQKSENRPGP